MSKVPSTARIPWPNPPDGVQPILNTDRRAHVTGLNPTSGINFAALGAKMQIAWNAEGADGQDPAGDVWNTGDRPHLDAHDTVGHICSANLWLRFYMILTQDDPLSYPAKVSFEVFAKVGTARTLLDRIDFELTNNGNDEWWELGRVRGLFDLQPGEKVSFEVALVKAEHGANPLTLSGGAIKLLHTNPAPGSEPTEVKVIMR